MSAPTEKLAADFDAWALDAELHSAEMVPVHRNTLRSAAALLRSQQPGRDEREADWLDEREFYEAMQAYRHARDAVPNGAGEQFENVKRLVRARLSDPQAPMWAPIESAPKDGVYQDGHNHYSEHILAWWPGALAVARVRYWCRDDSEACNFLADGGYAVFPTHYIPMPPPPTTAGEGK